MISLIKVLFFMVPVLAFANAVYFKAKWQIPFMANATEYRDFNINTKESYKVPTMFADNSYSYANYPNLGATGLSLSFENTNLTMCFILPNSIDGIYDLVEKLQLAEFKNIDDHWTYKRVRVCLPKFRFSSDPFPPPDHEHNTTLQKLGINNTMFSNSADFSNMVNNRAANMHISSVQHRNFIDVNEVGCEANVNGIGSEAANVSVAVGVPMSLPSDIENFVANHPFVFVARNKTELLFWGQLIDF